MAQPITINGITFKTQKEALAHCKAMLGSYTDQETINETDSQFLAELLKRHRRAAEKIGCGVRRYFRAPGPKPNYGTSCFWLERVDDTVEHFSYKHCVVPTEDK